MARNATLAKLPTASDLADYGLAQEDMQKIFGETTTYPIDETKSIDDTSVCILDRTGQGSIRYPTGFDAVWFFHGYALPVEWFVISGEL